MKKWLIKDINGFIRGPLETQEVLKLIERGELQGQEQISLFPTAKWVAITQEAEFYDRMLDLLSGEQPSDDKTPVSVQEEETKAPGSAQWKPADDGSRTIPLSSIGNKSTDELGVEDKTEVNSQHQDPPTPIRPEKESSSKKKSKRKKEKRGEIIELQNLKPILKKRLKKQVRGPFFGFLIVVVVGLLFLFSMDSSVSDLRLLRPNVKAGKPLSPGDLANRVKRGVQYFVRDQIVDYLKAQSSFVEVVEGAPKHAETYALLCISYLELWPMVKQDARDLQTVSIVKQLASKADPAGPHGATCKIVDSFIRGNDEEASSQIETVLNQVTADKSPPILVYYLKARALRNKNELLAAVGYLNSAQKLWPQWVKPFIYEAELLQKLNDPNQAANRYRIVLKAMPDHQVARIQLGLIEYKDFRNYEAADKLLSNALSQSDLVPGNILSDGYFGLAEIALLRNDTSRALKMAQKSFSFNPTNTSAKNMILKLGGEKKLKATGIQSQQLVYEGDQYVREGNCNAAQAHYKSAFEANKNDGVAAMKAAKCLWTMSFSTESIDWLNKAIRADPNLIDAYVLLADYYTQRYDYIAAAKTLAKAQSVAPRSYQVFRGFALVELRRNNAKGAINFGKKALELYETDVETIVIMAKAHLLLGEFREAYALANKAIELDVSYREGQVVFAKTIVGVQGAESALGLLTNLINNYPHASEYRIAYGEVLLQDERYPAAEKVFRQVIEIEEKPKKAYMLLAQALRFQGNLDPALDALLKAAVLDPADAEPLFQSAILYLEVKKPADARAQLGRVLRINPKYPLIHFYLGQVELMLNNPEGAVNEAKLERANNPNLAESYTLAAEAYFAMQQYKLCATEYQNALRLRPQGAEIYVKIARCYRLTGSLDIAITMLNQAASRESGYADIYKEQGAIFEAKGDIEAAVAAYNQYFTLDPTAPDRDAIMNRIQRLSGRRGN